MNKIIKTSRLFLRPIEDGDINQVFKGLSHPEVIKYYGVSFHSLEATKEQMEWYANLIKTNTGIWWAVCDKDSLAFLGAGGLNDMSFKHRKAEIGFWLLPKAWGKGYMTESMPAICDFAFNRLNLHRIEGFVFSNNALCKKALSKLDFDFEGTMRDCEVRDGEFLSVDIYANIKK